MKREIKSQVVEQTAPNIIRFAFTRSTAMVLEEKGIVVEVIYQGAYMTALDMKGFSISILKVCSVDLASAFEKFLKC